MIFHGYEYCPECDSEETEFTYDSRKETIKCKNCGAEIHPCSLCDNHIVICGEECHRNIIMSLIKWNPEYTDELLEDYFATHKRYKDYPDFDDNFEGVDICPHCDAEVTYVYNPVQGNGKVKCTNCGKMIRPCDLCHSDDCTCGDRTCKRKILKALVKYNFTI